jgi:5-formyltetrahydrofolate cyclo-ligase
MSEPDQPYPEHQVGIEVYEVKEELRRALRARRAKISPRAMEAAGMGLAKVVTSIPAVENATCVAAYVSRPTEPPTMPLLDRLAARGCRIMLPVLGSGLRRDWAWYRGPGDLQLRAPGRPAEPAGPPLGPDALTDVQAVIAPALAVDTDGARLGQGGGWYDRVLRHAPADAVVVATVFDEEVYDASMRPLPREPHDRAVDIVATPSGWRWLREPDAA